MKAIVVEKPGDEDAMRIGDVPEPALGPEDVRIAVRATAVNRADLLQRRGFYPPPPGASPILGLECAGEVVEVGAAVPAGTFARGDRVMALLAGGGYAEQVAVHHGSVMKVPPSLDLIHAGGFPEVYLTVFLNVFQLGGAKPGGAVLVHGGGSGVGTAAIQLAREAGLRCFVTAGSDDKCAKCLDLGADAAINYKTEDFAERVAALTDKQGVDVILDPIGGSYLERNVQSLAVNGRLVIIGLTGGASAPLPLALLLTRRLQVIGSTLRVRSHAEKAAIVHGFEERFGEAVAAGRLGVIVDRVLPLERAPEAHRIVAESTHFGKVVLQVR
jgi:putative PIG3 family NAD(P)H quinone oxidoreductase